MNEPKTPQKARPRLGSRSRTAEASFTSPSKRTDTAESDVGSPKKQKQHHLPFFHTAHHDHHHRPHLHYKSKRVDDVGSKTNLRQHLPNVHPVEGLATMISNHSEPKPGLGSQAPTRRHSQELSGESQLVKLPSRPIRPEDVEREREKGILRERELRSSLNELSELATGTTQRLDSAFYTLLEKVGQLRSTITSLQELSESSHELYDNFRRDIDSAEKEFTGQIDAFDGFKGQQDEVQKLLDRITTSKQQSETLGARLEAARKRVELWETREKEWQKKTSSMFTNFAEGMVTNSISRTVDIQLGPHADFRHARCGHRDLEALRTSAFPSEHGPIKHRSECLNARLHCE